MVREVVKVVLILAIGMLMLPFVLGAELLKKFDGSHPGVQEAGDRGVPPRRPAIEGESNDGK